MFSGFSQKADAFERLVLTFLPTKPKAENIDAKFEGIFLFESLNRFKTFKIYKMKVCKIEETGRPIIGAKQIVKDGDKKIELLLI